MSLAFVIDMNLSPEWVPVFNAEGWPSLHWSEIGDPKAEDVEIMDWARSSGQAVFTHDLDYTTVLALTHATGPSLLQVRGTKVLPEDIGTVVIDAIRKYQAELEQGALVTVDLRRARVRVLPL